MLINQQVFKPKRFSSGELKLVKSELDKYIINNTVEILFDTDFSIFELLLIIDYYKSKHIIVDLILAYLPYQRMDHTDRDELNSLQNVANLFNNLNLNSITICEPHCDISGFNNSKKISLVDKIKNKVFEEIDFNTQTDYIVLTDKGGYKRYFNLAKNVLYFNKERDINTGLIIKQEIIGSLDTSKKILIIDDIISTGDTIVNVVECLTSLGAKEIFVLSGHFEKNKYNKRLLLNHNIKKVFSTNSLTKKNSDKLKLFNIKEIIYG